MKISLEPDGASGRGSCNGHSLKSEGNEGNSRPGGEMVPLPVERLLIEIRRGPMGPSQSITSESGDHCKVVTPQVQKKKITRNVNENKQPLI